MDLILRVEKLQTRVLPSIFFFHLGCQKEHPTSETANSCGVLG